MKKSLKKKSKKLQGTETKKIPSDIVFKLYDTYGFPPEETKDLASEYGYEIDPKRIPRAIQKAPREIKAGCRAQVQRWPCRPKRKDHSIPHSNTLVAPGAKECLGRPCKAVRLKHHRREAKV